MSLTALLERDSFTLKRLKVGADNEGRPYKGQFDTVGAFVGTWGSPSTADVEIAGRDDQLVTGVVAGNFPALVGDRIYGLRGKNWQVTMVRQLVTHKRAFLVEVDG